MPLQPGQVDRNTWLQIHAYHIGTTPGAWPHVGDVGRIMDQPLGEQKADGQLFITAWRTHRDGHVGMAAPTLVCETQANLQRLFDGEQIILWRGEVCAADTLDRDSACAGCVRRKSFREGLQRYSHGGDRES